MKRERGRESFPRFFRSCSFFSLHNNDNNIQSLPPIRVSFFPPFLCKNMMRPFVFTSTKTHTKQNTEQQEKKRSAQLSLSLSLSLTAFLLLRRLRLRRPWEVRSTAASSPGPHLPSPPLLLLLLLLQEG